ncbi:TrmH family RNA methyltransferase [Aureimonas pseudogalii]|uniref:tRNA G18 (Ribose-2'-O)-methylase SpoU n=1 Tax=Aureimonas pseudogalii TaxID=1744844 RepID=A0A7W6H5K5_9HYPH|nr:RNA methyltransferase [Aureimonas pseudogalii]MBB3998971.1 tRNA G18 (ribose-2'-O)-methylase SpoU [Aureimonas pseudogalii]
MRAPIPITDPSDPRIDAYRDVRDRDLTGRGGFMAEGAVVLEQLLASRRYRPVSLLVLPGRWAGLSARLAALPDDVPVFTAERAVFDAVSGFPMNRGILAHGTERSGGEDVAEPMEAVLAWTVREGGTVVVACGLTNHDNVGGLFRNAAAFGAGAVLLDDRACDPLYRKAIRVSVGTVLTVPFARGGAPSQIRALLTDAGFECLALSPGGELRLDAIRERRPRALFLGTEGEGLDGRFLAECRSLRIAMAPGLDSLNVATSAAIALHHFFSLSSPD